MQEHHRWPCSPFHHVQSHQPHVTGHVELCRPVLIICFASNANVTPVVATTGDGRVVGAEFRGAATDGVVGAEFTGALTAEWLSSLPRPPWSSPSSLSPSSSMVEDGDVELPATAVQLGSLVGSASRQRSPWSSMRVTGLETLVVWEEVGTEWVWLCVRVLIPLPSPGQGDALPRELTHLVIAMATSWQGAGESNP